MTGGLGKDSCGCLYLVSGEVVFLVQRCDNDDAEVHHFSEGWRTGKEKPVSELQPVSDEIARQTFKAWGKLIIDGYAARSIAVNLGHMLQRRSEDLRREPA